MTARDQHDPSVDNERLGQFRQFAFVRDISCSAIKPGRALSSPFPVTRDPIWLCGFHGHLRRIVICLPRPSNHPSRNPDLNKEKKTSSTSGVPGGNSISFLSVFTHSWDYVAPSSFSQVGRLIADGTPCTLDISRESRDTIMCRTLGFRKNDT